MPDSNPPNSRPAPAGSDRDPEWDVSDDLPGELPDDLKDLDQALSSLLAPLAEDVPEGLADRAFEASVDSLPTRVLPFQAEPRDQPQRVRIPYLGYAAVILVAILSWVAVMNPGAETETTQSLAAGTSLTTFQIEEPRESEAMLMAVLDPSEDWFEDEDDFGDQFVTGVGAVLQTRGFGVDDLSGDVIAMLGGSPS